MTTDPAWIRFLSDANDSFQQKNSVPLVEALDANLKAEVKVFSIFIFSKLISIRLIDREMSTLVRAYLICIDLKF